MEQEMPAIRQEVRESVPHLIGLWHIQARHGNGFTARGGDAEDRIGSVGGEKNHVVAVPGPASGNGCVRQDLRHAACESEPFELGLGEKADRAAVRRSERKRRPVGSGKRACRRRMQLAEPEARDPVRIRDEHQLLTVG